MIGRQCQSRALTPRTGPESLMFQSDDKHTQTAHGLARRRIHPPALNACCVSRCSSLAGHAAAHMSTVYERILLQVRLMRYIHLPASYENMSSYEVCAQGIKDILREHVFLCGVTAACGSFLCDMSYMYGTCMTDVTSKALCSISSAARTAQCLDAVRMSQIDTASVSKKEG